MNTHDDHANVSLEKRKNGMTFAPLFRPTQHRPHILEFDMRKLIILFSFLFLVYSPGFSERQLTIKTEFCDTRRCEHLIDGVFIAWWDRKYDHRDDARAALKELNAVRTQALNDYKMQDPPNVGRGNYVNIYIHHPREDVFPDGWGNGVGTDKFKNPFMTLPYGAHTDKINLSHEGFHIFQYSGRLPYGGDTGWFIEAAASWNAAVRYPGHPWNFPGAYSFVNHPQLQMWHSEFFNAEVKNWGRGMHQYSMNMFLFYLTEHKGVPRFVVGNSSYAGITTSPQHYLYTKLGANKLREHWLDFASEVTLDLAFLTPEQRSIAKGEYAREMRNYPNDRQQYVAVLEDRGTNAGNIRPDRNHAPRGWGYNVIRINNKSDAIYTFHIDGDDQGDDETPAIFRARVLKSTPGKDRYTDVPLRNHRDGLVSVRATKRDRQLYLIVAAMPEHFEGSQRYYYSVRVEKKDTAPTELTWERCDADGLCAIPGEPSFQVLFRDGPGRPIQLVSGGERVRCPNGGCETKPLDWLKCADEGGNCAVKAKTALFKYGSGESNKNFAFHKTSRGRRVACTNARFGDPAPNVRKACYVAEIAAAEFPVNVEYRD